ncbi:Probable multidrug resistance-associated protein lethal(2)03659 [Gryllus bimaculatus]|nr:Probable multidrug resistance-associated protein lethal(2)03659 [Gryllus bimaculatus]
MQDGIGEKLGMFMFLVVSFVSSVIMSLLYGWELTLVVLSCAPVIIVATALVSKVQSSLAAREQEAYGSAGAAVEETLSAIRTVAAFAGQDKEAQRYAERLQSAEAMGCKRGLFSGVGGGVMWFIIYSSYSLALWYGVELILEGREAGSGEYTPAVLVIVLFGVLSGAMNMGMASPHIEAFAVARGAAAAVFAVLERAPLMDPLAEGGRRPERPPRGDLTLRAVRFSYPARPHAPVLRGLDLSVRRGETVALVGASGCGKSTVVQLLQRLYDPQDGQVLLDGEDVRELNLAWLRSHVGVVGQEPALFAVSIAENIRYGREDATRADIEAAAKEASAHDFITRLPQGYDTEVGERGTQLSGGQKQRIAIARALVRNPRILLLDEATSALDLQSEALVQRALERAARGRTTVVVAHRLSTIAAADRIVCLADGRVVEQGTHSELLALKGHYYALVAAAAGAEGGALAAPGAAAESVPLEQDGRADQLPEVLARQLSAPRLSEDDLKPLDAARLKHEGEEAPYEAPLSRIMAMNKPEYPHIAVGCLASFTVGASLPFFAVLFGEALSLESPEEVRGSVVVFACLFIVVGVMAGGGTFLQMYTLGVAGSRLTSRLRREAFAALLRQEVAFFDEERHGVGATGSRIGSILQSTSTLVIGVLLSFYYTWKLTLVSMLSVPLVFTGVFLEARLMHGQGLHEKQALEGASKVAVEVIANVRTVAALGGERAFLRRYGDALSAAEAAGRGKMRWRGVVFAMGQCSWFLAYSLALYYGGILVANEGLPYQNVIKVSEALIFGSWMLGQSLAFAPNFSSAKLSAGRLFSLLDRVPRVVGSKPKDGVKMEFSASGVRGRGSFRLPTRPEARRRCRPAAARCRRGHGGALGGPSGCATSTCLQLLQRLYDPLAGSVLVDGRATTALPLEALRAQLGIVSQEPVLFDRTIAENIAYGDNARAVPIDEGYETRLGAKGTQLSGGQKQRIAIARALVRNPRILLLDEATSALDSQSEKVVQKALDEAQQGRTCIVIAHRLATVQQADVICVVNHGKIAEMGTHSQLLARRGLYYQLHQRDTAQAS